MKDLRPQCSRVLLFFWLNSLGLPLLAVHGQTLGLEKGWNCENYNAITGEGSEKNASSDPSNLWGALLGFIGFIEKRVVDDPFPDTRLSLSARGLRISIDAQTGGRVVSLQWKGKEFLTQAAVEPTYFGATFWPDPQSAWWPIDPALDGDPYTVMESSRDRVHLVGSIGKKGLQMEKFFILRPADTSVEIVYTLHNSSDSPCWVGPWELIRADGGLSFFPDGPHLPLPASDLAGVTDKEGIRWYRFDRSQVHDAQKLFSGSSEGWLAHTAGGLLFIKSYQQVKPLEIAPGQGQVELYTNPAATYVELETHG